ncbi:diaminopimelate epimerase [Blattabacterium cuenoti]|uniref:diaminopimelate epimerase n=1 Tax=Blattabacterium cuenoti TaxID=1653831 RepID=UPI00163CE986|nr:diaminopimelate epimerase [Blattabacterium cuenoti]
MKLDFFKLHGTGNDFIIINCMENHSNYLDNDSFLKKLCDRHLGIGSDGIILIKKDFQSDFYFDYYNSNGKKGTMCGNGGRCAVFFYKNYIINNNKINEIYFRSINGFHEGLVKKNNLVSIKLLDLKKELIQIEKDHVFLDTGSPHYVLFVEEENMKNINVYKEGRKIRYQKMYAKNGVNVNFVSIKNNNTLQVRTYERGVENETLSCGTGVTASVIASYETNKINSHLETLKVHTLGGPLWVSLKKEKNKYKNIYLTGYVECVFKGSLYDIKNYEKKLRN